MYGFLRRVGAFSRRALILKLFVHQGGCLFEVGRLFEYTLSYYKNNEAQICPKIKNKLKRIEARLQMQM